jgi:membrane protein required for colicin V production
MNHLFSNWNSLDYSFAGVILMSVILGLLRGLVREIISLVTWVAAFFAALKLSPEVSALMHSVISSDKVRYGVAVAIVVIVVFLVGYVASKIARGFLTVTGMGIIDRFFGAIFGAARGVLFVAAVLLVTQLTSSQDAPWVKQSMLAPYFQPLVTYATPMIPKEFQHKTTWIDKLKSIAHQVAH